MNFKKLSKEKRDKLILVVLVTIMALAGLGFGLIKWQYGNLAEAGSKKITALTKLKNMQDLVKRADQIDAELAETSKTLADLEEGMASGDLSSWLYTTIRQFKLGYKVEIPSISSILVADTSLLAKFPYKQVTVTVNGQAYYHDLGKFIADFENHFPHTRVANLQVEPLPSLGAGEKAKSEEKLDFKMDIISLVKPNPS